MIAQTNKSARLESQFLYLDQKLTESTKQINTLKSEVDKLKDQILEQNKNIDSLKNIIDNQKTLLSLAYSNEQQISQLLKALKSDGASLTDWLLVVISALLLILAFFTWRINERVAWFTGAMESHSTMMLRIEAKRGIKDKPFKIIWWDPSKEDFPFSGEHNKEADLEKIYIGIPQKYRSYTGSWRAKIFRRLSGVPS